MTNIKLSDRINRIEESGIRKVFALAANNHGEYVNLSIGAPHFNTPETLKEALKKSVDENMNAYTATAGRNGLKEKIAEKLNAENGIAAKPEDIIVTAGTSGAIFLMFASLFDEGDEVILPDPYFVMYKQVLKFFGVKIVYHDTYPDFGLHPERIEKLITPKTKAIIINTPNNPTGMVYGRDELKQLADIARKHGLLVISDEIYEKFDYDRKFFSIGQIYENTVTLNGFSKSLSVTGWRVGYAHGPSEIIAAMNKLQQYTFVCAPSMAQAAIEREFVADIDAHVKGYSAKREQVYAALENVYELNRTQGAFYAFVKIPENRNNFNDELLENKILAVPGEVFSEKAGYFRLSFAVADSELKKGLEILRKIVL